MNSWIKLFLTKQLCQQEGRELQTYPRIISKLSFIRQTFDFVLTPCGF